MTGITFANRYPNISRSKKEIENDKIQTYITYMFKHFYQNNFGKAYLFYKEISNEYHFSNIFTNTGVITREDLFLNQFFKKYEDTVLIPCTKEKKNKLCIHINRLTDPDFKVDEDFLNHELMIENQNTKDLVADIYANTNSMFIFIKKTLIINYFQKYLSKKNNPVFQKVVDSFFKYGRQKLSYLLQDPGKVKRKQSEQERIDAKVEIAKREKDIEYERIISSITNAYIARETEFEARIKKVMARISKLSNNIISTNEYYKIKLDKKDVAHKNEIVKISNIHVTNIQKTNVVNEKRMKELEQKYTNLCGYGIYQYYYDKYIIHGHPSSWYLDMYSVLTRHKKKETTEFINTKISELETIITNNIKKTLTISEFQPAAGLKIKKNMSIYEQGIP